MYLLLLVTAAAVLLSTIYLMLTRMFTRLIMHITLILSIMLNMYVFLEDNCLFTHKLSRPSGICVYYWITKYYCSFSLLALSYPTLTRATVQLARSFSRLLHCSPSFPTGVSSLAYHLRLSCCRLSWTFQNTT